MYVINKHRVIDCGEAKREQREVRDIVIVRYSVNSNLFLELSFFSALPPLNSGLEMGAHRVFEGWKHVRIQCIDLFGCVVLAAVSDSEKKNQMILVPNQTSTNRHWWGSFSPMNHSERKKKRKEPRRVEKKHRNLFSSYGVCCCSTLRDLLAANDVRCTESLCVAIVIGHDMES